MSYLSRTDDVTRARWANEQRAIRNDVVAAVLNVWRHIKIGLCLSMRI